MRAFITLMEKLNPLSNPRFARWFAGSKVVDDNGAPLLMYHGTSQVFDAFDTDKIKADETDAPFNGFWFSSSQETSPAFHNPKSIMPVYLSIKNPAPWQVWRKVAREVYAANETGDYRSTLRSHARSYQDEVRYRLIDMGYDGIVFDAKPEIDAEKFHQDRVHHFRDARGNKHRIELSRQPETKWGSYTEEEAVLIVNNGEKDVMTVPDNEYGLSRIYGLIALADSYADGAKTDFSQFDRENRTGVIRTSHGKTLTVRKDTRTHDREGPVPTGRDVDVVDFYSDRLGHLTGYNDLDDFLESNSEQVWVAFFPTQIKSAFNRGDFSPDNPDLSESR